MSAQHTPGPWTVSDGSVWGRSLWGAVVRLADVTQFSPMNVISSSANANLIAAAPDFLAAARLVDEIWGASFDWSKDASGCSGWGPGEIAAIEALRAAIAKAIGSAS